MAKVLTYMPKIDNINSCKIKIYINRRLHTNRLKNTEEYTVMIYYAN